MTYCSYCNWGRVWGSQVQLPVHSLSLRGEHAITDAYRVPGQGTCGQHPKGTQKASSNQAHNTQHCSDDSLLSRSSHDVQRMLMQGIRWGAGRGRVNLQLHRLHPPPPLRTQIFLVATHMQLVEDAIGVAYTGEAALIPADKAVVGL
jgi:hypothetical protein